jgi:hypothetical protein
MKATASLLGVLLAAAVLASPARAQYGYYPAPCPPAYHPGYWGSGYSPNYCNPPFPPFQGMVWAPPNAGGNGGNAAFPTHPFARSPRDFYMIDFDRDTSPFTNPYRIGSVSGGVSRGVSGGGVMIFESATFFSTGPR